MKYMIAHFMVSNRNKILAVEVKYYDVAPVQAALN